MQKSKFQTESGFDLPGGEIPRVQKRRPYLCSQEFLKLSDEELCRNAQQGCAASRDLLWKRYIDVIRMVIYKENSHQHLPQHEIADALQELYFAFHTAVQRYDASNCCRGRKASFKTFLRIVVTHRFSNYCALWRIYSKHMVLDFDNVTSGGCAWEDSCTGGRLSVEATDLQLDEFSCDGLANTLRRLKPKERYLLETWLQYGRDKEVAKILGISPVAAKLRRERLFCRIRKSIAGK